MSRSGPIRRDHLPRELRQPAARVGEARGRLPEHRPREGARVAASCDWSLRSGYWFLPKVAFGVPLTDLPIWGLPEFEQRADPVVLAEGCAPGLEEGLRGDHEDFHVGGEIVPRVDSMVKSPFFA